jgi:hypothetical protein
VIVAARSCPADLADRQRPADAAGIRRDGLYRTLVRRQLDGAVTGVHILVYRFAS